MVRNIWRKTRGRKTRPTNIWAHTCSLIHTNRRWCCILSRRCGLRQYSKQLADHLQLIYKETRGGALPGRRGISFSSFYIRSLSSSSDATRLSHEISIHDPTCLSFRGLEPIPADIGREAGSILDRSPSQGQQTETSGRLPSQLWTI